MVPLIIGLVLMCVGMALAWLASTKPVNHVLIVPAIVLFGFGIGMPIGTYIEYGNEMSSLYRDASTQQISIEYNSIGKHVYSSEPCQIELDWREGAGFFVQGSETLATQNVINRLCAGMK